MASSSKSLTTRTAVAGVATRRLWTAVRARPGLPGPDVLPACLGACPPPLPSAPTLDTPARTHTPSLHHPPCCSMLHHPQLSIRRGALTSSLRFQSRASTARWPDNLFIMYWISSLSGFNPSVSFSRLRVIIYSLFIVASAALEHHQNVTGVWGVGAVILIVTGSQLCCVKAMRKLQLHLHRSQHLIYFDLVIYFIVVIFNLWSFFDEYVINAIIIMIIILVIRIAPEVTFSFI